MPTHCSMGTPNPPSSVNALRIDGNEILLVDRTSGRRGKPIGNRRLGELELSLAAGSEAAIELADTRLMLGAIFLDNRAHRSLDFQEP